MLFLCVFYVFYLFFEFLYFFLEKNTALSIVFFLQFGHWVEDFKFCSRKHIEKTIEKHQNKHRQKTRKNHRQHLGCFLWFFVCFFLEVVSMFFYVFLCFLNCYCFFLEKTQLLASFYFFNLVTGWRTSSFVLEKTWKKTQKTQKKQQKHTYNKTINNHRKNILFFLLFFCLFFCSRCFFYVVFYIF